MRRASCATEGQVVKLPVRVWRAPGAHELFASLGFDLMEVGQLEVTLRTGKQASRRAVQFALQALLALFGKDFFVVLLVTNSSFVQLEIGTRHKIVGFQRRRWLLCYFQFCKLVGMSNLDIQNS